MGSDVPMVGGTPMSYAWGRWSLKTGPCEINIYECAGRFDGSLRVLGHVVAEEAGDSVQHVAQALMGHAERIDRGLRKLLGKEPT